MVSTRLCRVDMDSGTLYGLTEQAHQFVGQHGKAQRGFGGWSPLQRLGQPGRNDVGNALAFQGRQDGVVEEAVVGAQQSNGLVAQMAQGRFEELQDVVRGGGRAPLWWIRQWRDMSGCPEAGVAPMQAGDVILRPPHRYGKCFADIASSPFS